MLVIQGLHASEATRGGRAYLVVGSMECVVVDTGAPDGALGVSHMLDAAKRPPHEVGLILLTHAHPGHAGNAAALRELTGARLAASAETARQLGTPGAATPRRVLLDRPRPWPEQPVEVDEILQVGQVLDLAGGIEVLDAAGHAPGSLAFHCYGPGALLVGDAGRVERRGGRLVAPPARRCADATAARATLERLAAVSARVVGPGHGLPTVDGRFPSRVLHGA
jgi:glyoxylase-like metal-dependent hydrolase (beta-lactamase superfamily II)